VRKWIPLIILASAQFIMVLDSSVMNVSISQIVDDLNTTVTGVQSAITMYTLVMAAFMLVGAKLEPHGAVDRVVWDRGTRRGAGDPGNRRADRRELRGEGPRVCLRDDRR